MEERLQKIFFAKFNMNKNGSNKPKLAISSKWQKLSLTTHQIPN